MDCEELEPQLDTDARERFLMRNRLPHDPMEAAQRHQALFARLAARPVLRVEATAVDMLEEERRDREDRWL